jgi:hypothetical protein
MRVDGRGSNLRFNVSLLSLTNLMGWTAPAPGIAVPKWFMVQ